jgi:hypothetical protein
MKKVLICTTSIFICSALLVFAGSTPTETFHGEIADSQCAMNIHSLTRSHEEMLKSKSMGGNATSCTLYCIRYMGGDFVLTSGKNVYYLDSPSAVNFAGEKVRVTGTLDPKNKIIHATRVELYQ